MLFFLVGLVVGLVVAVGLAAYILQSQSAKTVALEQRESALRDREALLVNSESEASAKLASIAQLSREEAIQKVVAEAEADSREVIARQHDALVSSAEADIDARARMAMLVSMERTATKFVSDATVAVVELPSEDMKGKIIGREGRNIRSFEQVTGVEVIVDESPESVMLSCFDPYRREIARLTLLNLMLDGRIHPARIEQLHAQATEEIGRMTLEAAKKAAEHAGVTKVSTKVLEKMGLLRFRTSYSQNVLDHSVETAILAERIAEELGADSKAARRAAFFHDIGKALDDEWPGPHAISGMEFLKSCGESEPILTAVGAHHHDIEPKTETALIVIVADTLSAARPGARRENLDTYVKRLSALEAIANGFKGVDRSFAVQAGREIRLIVKPEQIDDEGAKRLSQQVARVIDQDPQFSVPVKVTVIRETRVSTVSKGTKST